MIMAWTETVRQRNCSAISSSSRSLISCLVRFRRINYLAGDISQPWRLPRPGTGDRPEPMTATSDPRLYIVGPGNSFLLITNPTFETFSARFFGNFALWRLILGLTLLVCFGRHLAFHMFLGDLRYTGSEARKLFCCRLAGVDSSHDVIADQQSCDTPSRSSPLPPPAKMD